MSEPKTPFVRVGDFFFRYRNVVFPVLIFTDLILFPPRPSYFDSEALEALVDALAIAMVTGGLALRAAVIGFAYIKRGGLNKKVHAETLVTEGFFAAGRNPLYVANMIIYSGVFLMQGGVFVVVGPLVFLAIYSSIIAAEEHFLRDKFGSSYVDYCRATPRWGIRLAALRPALRGMSYDWRRVVAKDYTTFANAAFAVTLVEFMEHVAEHGVRAAMGELDVFGPIFAAIGLAVLLVRVMKKRTDLLHT